jgi:pentatricopeptide repeat protein
MVWKNWIELDVMTRKAYAHRLLIYLLDRAPGLALRFIQVIANDPLLRGRKRQAIADGLGHLSKIHTRQQYGARQKWGTDPMAHRRVFVPAFVNIFSKTLASQSDLCSQDLLYNLVELAKIEDLKKVLDCLAQHRTRIGFDTMLHYASAFGEAGEVEYALKCLDELRIRFNDVAWESVVGRERLRWTCATILRKSMSTSHNFHQAPSIVATFVRLGIKMDILLYNIVMHNAMEAGDYVTAFKVYNALESNGLEPNAHTYSILLHGCTLQNNPAVFQDFAQHCAEIAQQTKDPWLATDYLYYLYVRHQTDIDAGHRSALLWDAYLRFFSMAPLQPFITSGMMNPGPARQHQDAITPDPTTLSPPPVALYVMIQAEIQTAAAISNQRVLNLYRVFKSVATEAKDAALRSLIQNPIIWNAFLLAFSQKQQFANASQVIKDMTDSPTKPNIYSWNILMQAFFKTGQVQAAERVFEIMRNRGVDPDQFTYGVLIRGYAKAQLVERIGETMQQLETDQELKPDLLRALAAVVNRRQLMLTLEKGRLYKEARAQENAEREAEDERVRWQPPLFDIANVDAVEASEKESTRSNAPAVPYTEDPAVISKVPGTISDVQAVEDADIFGFLREETVDPAAAVSTAVHPVSVQTLQQPQKPRGQPKSVATDVRDPEVQYRKLQEQLGLAGHSQSPVAAQPPEPQCAEPLGASIGFKSLLGTGKDKAASQSSAPKGRVRPKMRRVRLDRPFSK